MAAPRDDTIIVGVMYLLKIIAEYRTVLANPFIRTPIPNVSMEVKVEVLNALEQRVRLQLEHNPVFPSIQQQVRVPLIITIRNMIDKIKAMESMSMHARKPEKSLAVLQILLGQLQLE